MRAPVACLFDLDGLLLDTEPLHGQAWGEAARHFGTALSEAQLLHLRGRRRLDCAEQVVQWLDKPVRSDQLLAIQQPIARRLLPSAAANPGAKELVQWCADHNLPMALVTSSGSDSVTYKTASHPWIAQIGTRVLGDDPDLKAGKPAPGPFLLAAQRLGVTPNECWAFEDSSAGSQAALAAGCRLWVLKQGGETGDLNCLSGHGRGTVIQSLEEVMKLLRTLQPTS
ncbi:MAG: HAD family phosphatase [Synechococcus sp.]|nr:HAD family phosphatase [Synechococcus sp.]